MARTVGGRIGSVVVVGAGLAGLAAALHLRGDGLDVTVVERRAHPGGVAGRLEVDGHHIDTGPTVLTMPELLDEAFAAVGDRRSDRLELLPLHPAYRAVFADGAALDVHTDAAAMEQAVRDFAGGREAAGYRALREWLTRLYRVERDRFIGANFDRPWDVLGRDFAALVGMGGFRALDPMIGRFLKDPRLRRVFTFQSLYAGVAPSQARAAYAVIAYMDTIAGVYFPKGGMHAVPRAMAEAAADAGVRFHYSTEVTGYERRGERVRAVLTEHDRFPCDAVVVTGAPPRRRLVPPRWSPSAVVAHVSTSEPVDLAHHTISFGDEWAGTFREIIDEGRLMTDPSLLLTTPSVTDPALAPAGRNLHYLLAPCPNLESAPLRWDRLGRSYAEEVVGHLVKRNLLPATAEVTHLSLTTPDDWARQGHPAGTPFSLSHTVPQTGPFRPGNLPRRRGNVVLAGAATTPGVGIPPVLISGRLAAQRLRG